MPSDFETYQQNIISAYRSAPEFVRSYPGVAVGAASSASPVSDTQAAAQFEKTLRMKDQLDELPDFLQESVWSSLRDEDRQSLLRAGFTKAHRGILDKVADFVKNSLPNAVRALHTIPGFRQVLDVMGKPLHAVQHVVRAGQYAEREAAGWYSGENRSLFSASNLFSWHWSNAWRQTGDKKADFYTKPERVLADNNVEFPKEYVPVLVGLVGGRSPAELTEEFGDSFQAAVNDPNFEQALTTMEGGQLSLGRAVAHGLGLRPGMKQKLIELGPVKIGPTIDPFKDVSGAADALQDVVLDPVIVGGKALQAAELARRGALLVQSAEDVRRLAQTSSGFQRWLRFTAEAFKKPESAVGVLRSSYPNAFSDHLLTALAKEAPTTVDGVQNVLEGLAARLAVSDGRAAKYFAAQKLSLPVGAAYRAAVKRGIIRGFESAEKIPVVGRAALGFRRLTNLVAPVKTVNLLDASSLETVDQFAKLVLPQSQVDGFLTSWAHANLGGRYDLWQGLVSDVMRQYGLPDDVVARFVGSEKASIVDRSYGMLHGEDVSRMAEEAKGFNAGLFEHQLSPVVQVPDFRAMVLARRDIAAWRSIPGLNAMPVDAVDQAMTRFWKPGVISGFGLRVLGFPARVGGEEWARFMFDNGLIPALKVKLGVSAGKSLEYLQNQKLLSPVDFQAVEWLGRKTIEAATHLKEVIAGPEIMSEVYRQYVRHGVSMLPGEVSALHDRAGFSERPDSIVKRMKVGRYGKERPIYFKPTGAYKKLPTDGEDGLYGWAEELARHQTSGTFKVALEHLDDSAVAREAIYQHLASEELAGTRSLAARAQMDSQGRRVGEEITEEEALRDWAVHAQKAAEGLVSGVDGVHQPLVDMLRAGKVPTVEDLRSVPQLLRPVSVNARELIPMLGARWEGLVDKPFEKMGRMIDAIGRRDFYVFEALKARKEIAPIMENLRKSAPGHSFEKLEDDLVQQIATDRVVPFIHDTSLRSQFAVANKNLFPFFFAHEQWLKRWGKTIVRNPAVVRKAQLTMLGLRHAGIVRKDENGNDYFYYPGVGFAQSFIHRVAPFIFGGSQYQVPLGLRGYVKNLSAGIGPEGAPELLPAPGPITVLPLKLVKSQWPDLGASAEDLLSAGRSSDRPLVEQLVPAPLVRLWRLLSPSEADSQYASALTNAAQMLEATGHGLPADPTNGEINEFQGRVKQQARAILTVRTLYGYAGPASPQVEYVGNLSKEYLELVQRLGPESAHEEWVKRHPDGSVWEVFPTTTKSGHSISQRVNPSEVLKEWFEKNQGVVDKYGGSAASWFMPDAPGPFNQQAWSDELANGLRVRRSPLEMIEEVKRREAASVYYPSRDAYQNARDGMTDPEAKRQLDAAWSDWTQQFLNLNPFFAQSLAEGGMRSYDRGQTIGSVRRILADPHGPKSEDLSLVIASLDSFNAYLAGLGSSQSDDDERRRVTAAFAGWGAGLQGTALQFFQSLILPDLRSNG